MLNIHVKLTVGGHEIEGAVPVPEGKVSARAVLPVLRQLTDTVVALAIRSEAEAGRQVSCRAGCGACCRQMVPVSPAEAFGIRMTTEGMKAMRRKKTLQRFAVTLTRLDKAGLLESLRERHILGEAELAALDRAYFGAGVACPVLEDESCGIYADRPLACREYLVTSPAKFCKQPRADRVVQVPMPAKVSAGLTRAEQGAWVPLVLALEFADHAKEIVNLEAGELVRKVLGEM